MKLLENPYIDARRNDMTRAQEQVMTQVVSRDGTQIAYFTSGDGPPVLLVHGLLGDHTRWQALGPHLEPHFRVHAMDRRGRGGSGDAPEYAFEREGEDVAAVVDAVAEASGTAVDVFGSSGGALYAIGAAMLTSQVRRLVLFEPPPANVTQLLPPGLLNRLDALLAQGERERLLVAAYRTIVGLSDEEIDDLRSQPSWANRVAAAHTVPRELRSLPDSNFVTEQTKRVRVPALVLVGGDTPDRFQAGAETIVASLPDARLAVLEGQDHGAEMFAPAAVAEQVLAFLQA
jgi:pimeloyl-ACP methyl ester carboxylesterase